MATQKTISQCLIVKKPNKQEHEAIKNLSKGIATEHQQRLALKFIINSVSRAQDLLYIPGGGFDETAFLNGRAFVGQNILKLLNVPIGTYEDKAEDNV